MSADYLLIADSSEGDNAHFGAFWEGESRKDGEIEEGF